MIYLLKALEVQIANSVFLGSDVHLENIAGLFTGENLFKSGFQK